VFIIYEIQVFHNALQILISFTCILLEKELIHISW